MHDVDDARMLCLPIIEKLKTVIDNMARKCLQDSMNKASGISAHKSQADDINGLVISMRYQCMWTDILVIDGKCHLHMLIA